MSLERYPFVRDWLIAKGNRIELLTGKVDIGQRISTALMRIAAEELTLPLSSIDVAPVRTDRSPDEGITSGSNSIQQSGAAQRRACATARDFAVRAGARLLNAKPEQIELSDGWLSTSNSGRRLHLIELLAQAPENLRVDQTAPVRISTLATADLPQRGLEGMVAGTFQYVHDLERPGMLHARIVRPPVLDARLEDCDEQALASAKGAGLKIVKDSSFLAIAGASEWSVVKAAERLQRACSWKADTALPTGDTFKNLRSKKAQRLAVIDGSPSLSAVVSDPPAAATYSADFARPYTLHGPLGPSAAMAEFKAGTLRIKTHSQGIFFLRDSIADSLGMEPDTIVVEHLPGAGCYGHNAADDAAFEAALIACALPGRPVLLKYSRSDENGRAPAGPAMSVSMRAQCNALGGISSLWMETRGDTHRGRPRPGPNRAGAARLAANCARSTDIPRLQPEPNMNRHAGLHRNLEPIYDIRETHLVKSLVPDGPIRPSALRCLGATTNIFAIESMMDELAQKAKVDPIEFRLDHLSDPRGRAVLTRLEQMTAEGPAPNCARGIAYAQYKNAMTRVGLAVDLAMSDKGDVKLEHVCLVADAGRVVDPDGLRAQLEGGVLQGASWALYERLRWGPDGRESLDWDSYPVLRFNNVPRIDIQVIEDRSASSVGAGEASPPPTVAAIANAIFSATGIRLRQMPFDPDAILQAALES
ncbi:MAG: molybdopterin cofactor-binding domain-containing protein [Pseudomonadota bacterium]